MKQMLQTGMNVTKLLNVVITKAPNDIVGITFTKMVTGNATALKKL